MEEKRGMEDMKSVATLIKTISCPFSMYPRIVANDFFIGYHNIGGSGLYEKSVMCDEKITANPLVRRSIQNGFMDSTSLFYFHLDRRTGENVLLKRDFWKVQGGDDEEYYEDSSETG